MLKCYYKYWSTHHNGEHLCTTSAFVIEDENEDHEPHTIDINWDNYEDECPIHCGWYIHEFKKGRAAYFNDAFFPFAREYKNQPLNITLTISYREATASVNEILKYRDSNAAIQYLVERGLTVLPK